MAARIRQLAGNLAIGVPFGLTLCGAVNFLLEFPDPLPSFVEAANASDGVGQLIGTPITRSIFWNGKATRSQAVVSIPVSGPAGSGVLHGRAYRAKGPSEEPAAWEIIALDVECSNSGKVVDILGERAPLAEQGARNPNMEAMAAAMAAMHSDRNGNVAQQHRANRHPTDL